ncbi:MAG TPA: family 16 glycoside hydrolase [Bacillota bacterium]|nr:family 16 glycoside hydrolase [Bacillota bacterium]
MRASVVWALVLLALPAMAAERVFDFGATRQGQAPEGFRSTLTGKGKPGIWQVLLDEVPPVLAPLTPQAPAVSKRAVLAQTAQDPTDEHFPLLIFEEETFGDFTLTTRFKTVRGVMEQMAGIAFRIQNETNYYVVRASSLGNTFRFYKVVDGVRGTIIGPNVSIPSGVWHELTVECKGNQIRCLLNGKEVIPPLTDSSFTTGKIGFWTKSDSVSYFTDTKVVYTPREPPAQTLVREMLKKYPRLLDLEVYVPGNSPETTRLIANKAETAANRPGSKVEQDVISRGVTYYGKDKKSVSVTLPMRDRNGEAMAAVRVVMQSFTGQTEQNAVVRAAPIVKEMQARCSSLQDLLE